MFDSGIGGLSVWMEINKLLGNESTIYLADSKNAPYGEKSREKIIGFSKKNTELLLDLDCKIIVVACNTATTNAIKILRQTYPVPFIGIEPATKPAAVSTKTGKIGILATRGTLASELFLNTSEKYRGDVMIIEREGRGLVKLIEEGKMEMARPLLEKYLTPMIEAGVDNIVLGCTHYPFLKPMIKEIIPPSIRLIDSGKAVARQTREILSKEKMLNKVREEPSHQFFTNGDAKVLESFLKVTGISNYQAGYKLF